MLLQTQIQKNSFLALYENKELIFKASTQENSSGVFEHVRANLSKESLWKSDNNGSFHSLSYYHGALDWHLVYGFDMQGVDMHAIKILQELELSAIAELAFVRSLLLMALIGVLFICVFWLLGVEKISKNSPTQEETSLAQRDDLTLLDKLLLRIKRR